MHISSSLITVHHTNQQSALGTHDHWKARKNVGSISAALSCLVRVPPREVPSGEELGLLSRTAADDRA